MNNGAYDGWSMELEAKESETRSIQETRIGNWQQTFTGRQFWPLDPRPEDIVIEDIAHALSQICRFGGHCKAFYSVAQHSVLASYEVQRYKSGQDPRVQLWALLHDAAETYVGDMIRPLKRSPGLEEYTRIEKKILACILKRFDLFNDLPMMPIAVKCADDALCAAEARDLMEDPPALWELSRKPAPYIIIPMDPTKAEREFLARFRKLRKKIEETPFRKTSVEYRGYR